jgi:hypothetical protein
MRIYIRVAGKSVPIHTLTAVLKSTRETLIWTWALPAVLAIAVASLCMRFGLLPSTAAEIQPLALFPFFLLFGVTYFGIRRIAAHFDGQRPHG